MEETIVNTETQEPVVETVEQAPDTSAAQEPETETAASKEEAAKEPEVLSANDRLRKRYPDENPQTEEDWEKLRNRYMDDYETSQKDHESFEQEVNDLIASDGDLALVLNDMLVNKVPLTVALARNINIDDLKPQEGEDDYAAWDKAYKERLANNKKLIERQREIETNQERSFENIDKFCQERKYDDKAKEGIVDFINELFDAIVMKNISPELLEKIDKARTYDSAVRDAELKGEVKGRNANIEVQRAEGLEQERGDGIPTPTATGGSPLQPKTDAPKRSLMDSFMSGIGENKWMNNR